MLVEFSVFPVGEDESLSEEIAKAVNIVAQSGLPYQVTAMGTLIEGSWGEVMGVVQECHDIVRNSSGRVYTRIVIDDRTGRSHMLHEKVQSLEQALGRQLNT